MIYAKVTLEGWGTYIQPLSELETIVEEIRECEEVGSIWRIELVEMTPVEYDALPEFAGF